jgi:predicted O-methyltransferase YrrM
MQAAALLYFARLSPGEGVFMEIGADRGKSAVLLATAAAVAHPPCPLHSVDPFPSSHATPDPERVAAFHTTLQQFSTHNVRLHVCSSGEFRTRAGQPVRFIFVDAAHDYLNVRHDFLAWKGLVVPGGFLAAHDVDNPRFGAGVRRAFLKHILSDPEWKLRYHTDNLAIAQRQS